jgi:hypothetical protein
MDISDQRTQAHCLLDALPQDSLEIVVALLRKLAGNVNTTEDAQRLSDTTDKVKAFHELEAMRSEIAQYGPFDYEMDREAALEEKYGKCGG